MLSKPSSVDKQVPIRGEGSIDIPGGGRLLFYFNPIADLGVELKRVQNGMTRWVVAAAPLGVNHSRYHQEVEVRVDGDVVYVESQGTMGDFYEQRHLDTGRLLNRTQVLGHSGKNAINGTGQN